VAFGALRCRCAEDAKEAKYVPKPVDRESRSTHGWFAKLFPAPGLCPLQRRSQQNGEKTFAPSIGSSSASGGRTGEIRNRERLWIENKGTGVRTVLCTVQCTKGATTREGLCTPGVQLSELTPT
jgi:hypothetical protein